MARYIKTVSAATAAGGQICQIGGPSATIEGCGAGIYDTPGAWTPIDVCCNWNTAFNGRMEFCFNPSCYDELRVMISPMSKICYNYSHQVQFYALNRCMDQLRPQASGCCMCNCSEEMYHGTFYGRSGCCNQSAVQGNPYAYVGCACGPGSLTITYCKRASSVCTSNNEYGCMRPWADVTATGGYGGNGMDRVMWHPYQSCCYKGIYWPEPSSPKDYSGDEYAFTKIIVCAECCCFMPGAICTDGVPWSALPTAVYGIWGKVRNFGTETGLAGRYSGME